jgi:hypothetical protein
MMLSCYMYDSTVHVALSGTPPPGGGKFRPLFYAKAGTAAM